MRVNDIADRLSTFEKLDYILADGQRLGAAALRLPVSFDTEIGIDEASGWLLLQRPSTMYEKPWVRQVVLRSDGAVELVQAFDCASDNLDEVVAAGAQGYYRHRELTQRSYFEMTSHTLPLMSHLRGDITLHDIHTALHAFAAREKLDM